MADATFATDGLEGDTYNKIATINSTDVKTEILVLNPEMEYSLGIDLGAGETLELKVSFAATPATANLISIDAAIAADYTKVFDGGITGIEVSSAATANDSVIYLIQRNRS